MIIQLVYKNGSSLSYIFGKTEKVECDSLSHDEHGVIFVNGRVTMGKPRELKWVAKDQLAQFSVLGEES